MTSGFHAKIFHSLLPFCVDIYVEIGRASSFMVIKSKIS